MFVTFLSTALLAFLCGPTFGSAFNVSTPVLTQCASVQLSWDSTSGPFDLVFVNQSDPCGYVVVDLGKQDTNSVTWIVDIPQYWSMVMSVEDSSGEEGWSQPIIVQPSNNTSCLPPEFVFLAEHPGPTATTTTGTSGGSKASASPSASAAAGANKGNGGAPSARRRLPSTTALFGTIAIAIAVTVASACLAL